MLFVFCFVDWGCGVKGDPMPPDRPPTMGRGNPTFRKATEEISLPASTGINFEDLRKQEEDQDEQEDFEEE